MFGTSLDRLTVQPDSILEIVLFEELVTLQLDGQGALQGWVPHPGPGGSLPGPQITAFPLVLKVTPWKTNGAIGNPLPHWISHTPLEIQPPQKSNGVSEFQWISRLMCSIGIPIPHRNSKHTMNNYFSPLEIQWVFHSFVMDGQRNEHSKTNIDFKSVKIHLGSLENRCPLKPLSCL